MSESLSGRLADPAATERLGAAVARSLNTDEHSPGIIHLRGDLGAGKTTFVRGFLRQLGWQGAVRSPTYTLLEPYHVGPWTYVHADLYRLKSPSELEDLGLRDYLQDHHVLLIEWPEQGDPFTPAADLAIAIDFEEHEHRSGRRARLNAHTVPARGWLQRMHLFDSNSN